MLREITHGFHNSLDGLKMCLGIPPVDEDAGTRATAGGEGEDGRRDFGIYLLSGHPLGACGITGREDLHGTPRGFLQAYRPA
jgi:hypothetical protein